MVCTAICCHMPHLMNASQASQHNAHSTVQSNPMLSMTEKQVAYLWCPLSATAELQWWPAASCR